MLNESEGVPSDGAWWGEHIPDNWLDTLFDAAYRGPDAVWPLDDSAVGGMSVEEQLLVHRQSMLQRLKQTSLQTYKVYLRLWYRWVTHQKRLVCQHNGTEISYVAHPDSKVDRFIQAVLAEDGPLLSKGNLELYPSIHLMCAALTWLRLLQPGVPDTRAMRRSEVMKKALHSAGQLRAALHQSSEHDLMAKSTSKILQDSELDKLLQRCAFHVADGRHWGHKAAFCLLAGRAAGYRVGDLCNARYVGLSLSSVETQPTPEMKLLLLYATASKRNSTGQQEHVILARHAEPTKCPVGALSRVIVYDLLAYELQLVPLMLSGDSSWRSMHLLWRDPGCIMSPQNYNDIVAPIKQLLDEEGLTKTAVGHLGRNTGQAELNRWDFLHETIRLWGRWLQGAYEQSYLPKAPLKLLSVAAHLAGHDKDTWRTTHILGRQTVTPPDAWVDAVMPGVREALVLLKHRNGQCRSLKDRDISAVSCLETLLHLGEVFWQDLAFCDAGMSNLPVIHDIVGSEEFATFKQRVLQAHLGALQHDQQQQETHQHKAELQNSRQSPLSPLARQAGALDAGKQQVAQPATPDMQAQTSQKYVRSGTCKAVEVVYDGPHLPPTPTQQENVAWRTLCSWRQVLSDVVFGSTPCRCQQQMPITNTGFSSSNDNISSLGQQVRVARRPGRPTKQRRCVALFEAPPLFSSKLKAPSEGWAEWQGLATGRPGVKQVLERIGQDSKVKLGISNSNAKCKRMWLLRAVDAATSVGMPANVAVQKMDAIAATYQPPLTYLEFLTAMAAVAKHHNNPQSGSILAVRSLTVADIMRQFDKQYLPLPIKSGDNIAMVGLDCRKHGDKAANATSIAKRARAEQVSQHVSRVTRQRRAVAAE